MVSAGLFAAGAVANSVSKTFQYNRTGWMNDVQVAQARRYQKQNVRIKQADMFREDIRDLVSAAVTKQNSYVVTATLILTLIAECYIEGPLPDGAPDFIRSVYMLCLGSALTYMVMSVLSAAGGMLLAFKCQRELLTTLVRIPIDEFVAEINEMEPRERVEAFEEQSVNKMLRMPFLSVLRKWTAPLAPECLPPAPSPKGEALPEKTVSSSSLRETASVARVVEEVVIPQAEKAEAHLKVFDALEQDWELLASCSFAFATLGAGHLLQAYGYFAAAKYYDGYGWSSACVQGILVSVDAIFAGIMLGMGTAAAVLFGLLNVAGPLACTLGVRLSDPMWVDALGIPFCFACHVVRNACGLREVLRIKRRARENGAFVASLNPKLTFLEAVKSTSAAEPERPGTLAAERAMSGEVAAAHVNLRFSANATVTPPPEVSSQGETDASEDVAREVVLNQRRLWLGVFPSGVVTGAWAATFIWSIVLAVGGVIDDGGERRLTSSAWFAAVEASWGVSAPAHGDERALGSGAQELVVEWPSPRFRPSMVRCDRFGSGACYAANEFRVYELRGSASTALACDITGRIVDLVLDCGAGPCSLAVVQEGGDVVPCGADGPLAQRGAYRPRGGAARATADVAAVDYSETGPSVAFHRRGGIEAWDSHRGSVCASWRVRLLRGRAVVMSGTLEGRHSAVLLVGGEASPRLFRVMLPGLPERCGWHGAPAPSAGAPARRRSVGASRRLRGPP